MRLNISRIKCAVNYLHELENWKGFRDQSDGIQAEKLPVTLDTRGDGVNVRKAVVDAANAAARKVVNEHIEQGELMLLEIIEEEKRKLHEQ